MSDRESIRNAYVDVIGLCTNTARYLDACVAHVNRTHNGDGDNGDDDCASSTNWPALLAYFCVRPSCPDMYHVCITYVRLLLGSGRVWFAAEPVAARKPEEWSEGTRIQSRCSCNSAPLRREHIICRQSSSYRCSPLRTIRDTFIDILCVCRIGAADQCEEAKNAICQFPDQFAFVDTLAQIEIFKLWTVHGAPWIR